MPFESNPAILGGIKTGCMMRDCGIQELSFRSLCFRNRKSDPPNLPSNNSRSDERSMTRIFSQRSGTQCRNVDMRSPPETIQRSHSNSSVEVSKPMERRQECLKTREKRDFAR